MKVVRKILYIIAGLLILITILIVVCAYNPGLTKKMQGFIFRGRAVEVKETSEDVPKEDTEETAPVVAEVQEEYRMRSLEELGISEDSLIRDLDAYYADCHQKILEHGVGEYSFENVVATEELVQQIYSNYSNKNYVDAYMDEVLKEIGAYSYDMNLVVEELEGKNFRLTHQVILDGAF